MIDYLKFERETINNLLEQFLQIIVRPRKVFYSLKSKTLLSLLPVFLMIIGSVFKVLASFPAQINLNSKYMDQFINSLPPEQMEQMEHIAINTTPDSIVSIICIVLSTIIGVIILWAIKATLLHYITTKIGGKGSIVKSLNIVGFSWMSLFLFSIIQGIYALISGNILFASGRLQDAFLSTTNIFTIWNMVLLIMGYSLVYGLNKRKAAVGVIGLWLITFVFSVGGIFSGHILWTHISNN